MWCVTGSHQQSVEVCFGYLHDRGKGNLSLKMEATSLSQMFIIFHHTAWNHILEDSNHHCVIYF
jgi:hypothetical protein